MAEPETPSPAPVPPSPNAEFAEKLLQSERARVAAEREARDLARQAQEEVKALKGQFDQVLQAQPKPLDPANPLGSVDESRLYEVVHDPDQDAQNKRIAMDEILRRQKEVLKRELRQEQEARFAHERDMQDALDTARRDFGEKYLTKGTPENEDAQRHMTSLQRRYGDEVAWDPKMQILAVSMAHSERLKAENEKAKEVERDRDEMKRRLGLQQGGNQNVYRPEEPAKELLKKGDVKGALRSMKLFSRLTGEG